MPRQRRREELYVTVPSVFRCPISMDVMKSPVSLCTGVTYDRSSIEKWLALGHNTCPATMQSLPSTNTTPNLTLRRLIHLWLSQSDAAQVSSPGISKQQAAGVINGESINHESLAKLINFIRSSELNLKFVASSNDAVSRFVEVLSKSDDIRICELIVQVLDLILMENGVKESLNELILNSSGDRACLTSFALVFQKGNTESKVQSARILEQIALNSESQRKIGENQVLLQELYKLCTVGVDTPAAALSALIAVSTSRPVKKELIRFGVVRTVAQILSDYDYSGTARAITEKSMELLETIATCTEGRSAISEDEECVTGIVKRLMKCSRAATGHGITVLWSVCCLARDPMAQESVSRVNGLTKVLLVMQSDCTSNCRMMCCELVKVLRAKNTKSKLSPYETRTTHITPY